MESTTPIDSSFFTPKPLSSLEYIHHVGVPLSKAASMESLEEFLKKHRGYPNLNSKRNDFICVLLSQNKEELGQSQCGLLLPIELILPISLHLPSSEDIFSGVSSTCKLLYLLTRMPSFIIKRLMTLDLQLALLYSSIDRIEVWLSICRIAPKFLYNADVLKDWSSSSSSSSPLWELCQLFSNTFTTPTLKSGEVSEPPSYSTSFHEALDNNLVLPPDYLFFLTKCERLGESQEGLTFRSPEIQPYCWHYNECTALVRIGDNTDGGADGSSYFYLNCDITSPQTWGSLLFYTYRRDRCFHFTQYPTSRLKTMVSYFWFAVQTLRGRAQRRGRREHKVWFFSDMIQTLTGIGIEIEDHDEDKDAENEDAGSGYREWSCYLEESNIEHKPVPNSLWYYKL